MEVCVHCYYLEETSGDLCVNCFYSKEAFGDLCVYCYYLKEACGDLCVHCVEYHTATCKINGNHSDGVPVANWYKSAVENR